MTTTKLGVTIRRPVEDVFAVLSDVEKVPIWSRNTIEEKLLTPGPLGKGSRRRAVLKGFAGREMVNEAEMLEFEPNRKMVVRVIDAPVPARIVFDFLPVAEGTRLGWTMTLTPRGPLRLVVPLMAGFFGWAFQKDLDNLKALMESGRL